MSENIDPRAVGGTTSQVSQFLVSVSWLITGVLKNA